MLNISIAGSNELPVIEIEDVSKAKNLQDSHNPGVSRINIKLKTPAQSKSILKVIAVPERTGN
ncbi:MAG: hypothetical protein H7Z13_11995 [Ferruginibacter sp.]|nr:hypothetical protein [Ferruginibacter sp.]